jgi:hypothetical protein
MNTELTLILKKLLTTVSVKATALNVGYRIDAILENGEVITIREKGLKLPTTANLFDGPANQSGKSGTASMLFTFSKVPFSNWGDKCLKSFAVEL